MTTQTNCNCNCDCNQNYTMLPIRGFGLAVDAGALPTCKCDGSELEKLIERIEELEKNQCRCDCDCDCEGGGDDDETVHGTAEITLLGGTGADHFYDLIAVNGGYIACGETTSAGAGRTDALLVKFGNDLGVLSKTVVGGTDYDVVRSLVPTGDGGCLAFGDTIGSDTAGSTDAFVLGADNNATITGSSLLGSSIGDAFLGACATPAGFAGSAKYAAVGYMPAGSGLYTGFIATYDGDAKVLKSSRVGVTNSGNTRLHGVAATQNGFVAVGYTNNAGTAGKFDGLIIQYDPILAVQKKILVGGVGSDYFTRIVKTATGYVVGGYTDGFGKGGTDILLLTLDDNLNIVHKATIGGTGAETLGGLTMLPNGNLAITGNTTSAGAGGSDVLLMVLDKDLNVVKQLVFGGSGDETSSAVVANSNGSFTMVGYTPTVGAGNLDSFIATFKGKFTDLTGSLAKYPALRIDAGVGFTAEKAFSLIVNATNTVPVVDINLTFKANPTRTVITDPAKLIVDAGAV